MVCHACNSTTSLGSQWTRKVTPPDEPKWYCATCAYRVFDHRPEDVMPGSRLWYALGLGGKPPEGPGGCGGVVTLCPAVGGGLSGRAL